MNDSPPNGRPLPFARSLLAIVALGLVVRAWGLAGQPLLADDWAAWLSACAFVERGEVSGLMWHHPRLRDLLVYVSGAALGPGKLGLSFPSLVAGILSIAVVGLLARRVAGATAGLVAALLVALDPLHVHYSRQAINDVYMCLFGAAGVLFAMAHATSGLRRHLVIAGSAFGLGLASRWIVAAPLAVTCAWLVAQQVRARAPATRLAFTVAALGALPLAIYLMTWTSWFAGGRGMWDWLELQRIMFAEMRVHQGFNPATLATFPHQPSLWFLRPVWWADFTAGPEGHVVLVAMTNPVVWLATLPAVTFLARRGLRERRAEDALALALFCATWLPLALASRPIFANAALAVLPFAFVPIAALAVHLGGSGPAARARLGAYLALVAFSSAPLLLLATGAATQLAPLRGVVERFRPDARFEGAPPR